MSRRSVLQPQHAALVRQLRETHPSLGAERFAELVAERCGLPCAPGRMALSRFLAAHGMARAGYAEVPTENLAAQLARQAVRLAAARRGQAGPVPDGWPAGMARTLFVTDLSWAFHALLMEWGKEAGLPCLDELVDQAQQWRQEAA